MHLSLLIKTPLGTYEGVINPQPLTKEALAELKNALLKNWSEIKSLELNNHKPNSLVIPGSVLKTYVAEFSESEFLP